MENECALKRWALEVGDIVISMITEQSGLERLKKTLHVS